MLNFHRMHSFLGFLEHQLALTKLALLTVVQLQLIVTILTKAMQLLPTLLRLHPKIMRTHQSLKATNFPVELQLQVVVI